VSEGETHESTSLESLASGLEEDIKELLYISIPLALIDEKVEADAPTSSRQAVEEAIAQDEDDILTPGRIATFCLRRLGRRQTTITTPEKQLIELHA